MFSNNMVKLVGGACSVSVIPNNLSPVHLAPHKLFDFVLPENPFPWFLLILCIWDKEMEHVDLFRFTIAK